MSFGTIASTLGLGGAGSLLTKQGRGAAGNFLFGSPETREQVPTLLPRQKPIFNQLTQAAQQQGAGGAFGDVADYYRGLLNEDNQDISAFTNPALRQYNEEIIPGISEQFAGLGSGGLSSSGFRNAQVQGGVDLAERIAQMRAGLRQHGAAGLQNIGQLGLGNYSQNMTTQPGTAGLLAGIAPAAGTAIGAAAGGPIGAGLGSGITSWFGKGGGTSNAGLNSLPIGKNASPQI